MTQMSHLVSGQPTPPLEDSELLRRYAEDGAEQAFAELVRRRVGLVYSVALRQTRGDPHRAEDATQAVFTDLARKAPSLARRPVLAGWLYRSAQFAAAGLVRAEQRRLAREHEAHTMENLLAPENTLADWEKVRPVLDDALNELAEDDRNAILLRFFDHRPFAEIGARLQLTENTARMRVERALDKLHAALARRGITSTTAALGVALGGQAAAATPAGLAATVTGTALAGSASGAAAVFMGMTKLQVSLVLAVGAVGTAGVVSQARTNVALQHELAALQAQQPAVAALRTENQQLATAAAEIAALRRDDAELQQLAQRVAETQREAETRRVEQVRLTALRAQQTRRGQLETELREKDRLAQAEVERMNQEGNALVGQYKELAAKARGPTLSTEARTTLETATKAKMDEIQAKQREIRDFIKAAREAMAAKSAELRTLAPELWQTPNPPGSLGGGGRLELRRTPPDGTPPAAHSVPGEVRSAPAR